MKLLTCLAAMTTLVGGQPSRPNQNELRELLVNDHQRLIVLRRWDSIFYHEGKLRPLIRAFLRDDKARENAQEVLALIGDPDDLRLGGHAEPGTLALAVGALVALLAVHRKSIDVHRR